MPQNQFIHKIAIFLISTLSVLFLFSSCSNKSSVTFRFGDAKQGTLKSRSDSNPLSSEEMESLMLEVELSGDFNATKTVDLAKNNSPEITFYNIQVDSIIKGKASIYIKDEYIDLPELENARQVVYQGTSDEIVVFPGSNDLPITLKKVYAIDVYFMQI